jgi:hypothetical protein
MIKMVVCDKNRREGIDIKTVLLKNLLETAQTYTGIYQNAVFLSSQVIAVSAASARKTHESDCTHLLTL